MAWNRRIELAVGKDPSNPTATVLSGLDVDFRVARSNVFLDNSAEFTIYNASYDTRKHLLQDGANIVFKAGYEDTGMGVIFIGNIAQTVTTKAGTDYITHIAAVSIRGAGNPLESTMVSLSYDQDTAIMEPIQAVADLMGLVVNGIAEGVTLPNGFVFVGRAQDALRQLSEQLQQYNIGLYVDNAEIVIYQLGEKPSSFDATFLSYDTGLLSVREITDPQVVGFIPRARKAGVIVSGSPLPLEDGEAPLPLKRIGFESILIPKLMPNVPILVKALEIEGAYTIDSVQFYGNNYGGQFNCSAEATTYELE